MNLLLPFQFANLPVRGRFLRLHHLKAHVPSLQEETSATRPLTDMLAAAALLAFDAKYTLATSLQLQHPGLGTLLLAQCNPPSAVSDGLTAEATGGVLRAYANPQARHTAFELMAQTPGGVMLITLEPADFEQRYQSVLPLEGDSAAACLAHYFEHSVQTRTILKVFSNLDVEGGTTMALMLQALPGGTLEEDDWTRLNLLVKTLTETEATNPALTAETLLGNLFAEDDLTLYAPHHPQFAQDNPRPRMLAALAAMPKAELDELIQQGTVTLTDATTGQSVSFTAEELAHLHADTPEKTH